MAKVLIDIPEEDYKRGTVMASDIRNGIVLDGLTNGEFVERFLGAKRVHELHTDVEVMIVRIGKSFMTFDIDWWNRKWGE